MRPLNRRQFIKKAALTAASLGIPSYIPASALGRGGAVSANERITLGFIGLGNKGFDGCWGSLLHSLIEYKNCQVLATCDVDRRFLDRSKEFVDARYGNTDCGAYVDFRDLLARGDIDAVVIATPDHWHAIQTIEACKFGKDVYCEKPLSLTIQEARAMVNTARQYGRIVQTGSQSRSNPRIRFVCEAVKRGRIGKLVSVTAACGGPPIDYNLPAEPTPDYLNWDLWLGPAPWRPYNAQIHPAGFRHFRDYAGGGLADWGTHHFDMAQWALGMDHSGPVEILPPDDSNSRLRFVYADGMTVEHADISREEIDFFGVTFQGTEGTIRIQGISAEAHFEPEQLGHEARADVQQFHDLYSNMGHYDDFLNCIRTRRDPVADIEIGARSVTVCHLANIAYALNRPLRWDPEKEEFVNDAEANRYRSRAMRQPWRL